MYSKNKSEYNGYNPIVIIDAKELYGSNLKLDSVASGRVPCAASGKPSWIKMRTMLAIEVIKRASEIKAASLINLFREAMVMRL